MNQSKKTLILMCIVCCILSCGHGRQDSTASRINTEEGPSVAMIRIRISETEGSQGSGIIVDAEKGRFLTNWHVVEGIKEGWVRVKGSGWLPITGVVAKDEHKDLAVIEVDIGGAAIRQARIGSAHQLAVGDPVVVIGNPLGEEFSVSDGIVSQIRAREGYTVIQTTAPVSPGNSGGPLFNENGEVVGVVTFTANDSTGRAQNLNFAVAVDEAVQLIQETGTVISVVPGTQPPSDTPRNGLGLPTGSLRFAFVVISIVLIYLVSTFVVFRWLIQSRRDMHPSTAFGISSIVSWGGAALIIAFSISGYLDYLLGWQSSYSRVFLWGTVTVSIVLSFLIHLMTRPQPRK